ncbi:hypothetical protein EDB19DRAFT_1908174 [Suillus lakei]|nr:hypothetical protein EDB19DRAFT_1908174 [Suillus lakei]
MDMLSRSKEAPLTLESRNQDLKLTHLVKGHLAHTHRLIIGNMGLGFILDWASGLAPVLESVTIRDTAIPWRNLFNFKIPALHEFILEDVELDGGRVPFIKDVTHLTMTTFIYSDTANVLEGLSPMQTLALCLEGFHDPLPIITLPSLTSLSPYTPSPASVGDLGTVGKLSLPDVLSVAIYFDHCITTHTLRFSLNQRSSVEHPLDDPRTYIPITALFEARRLSSIYYRALPLTRASPAQKHY